MASSTLQRVFSYSLLSTQHFIESTRKKFDKLAWKKKYKDLVKRLNKKRAKFIEDTHDSNKRILELSNQNINMARKLKMTTIELERTEVMQEDLRDSTRTPAGHQPNDCNHHMEMVENILKYPYFLSSIITQKKYFSKMKINNKQEFNLLRSHELFT